MGCAIDLYFLSSMCCVHFCNSAALEHMKTLESTIGPGWKREQQKSCSVLYAPCCRVLAGGFHWLTADLKHVWWMWRVRVQGDGLQGKSRKGKDTLRDKRAQSVRKNMSVIVLMRFLYISICIVTLKKLLCGCPFTVPAELDVLFPQLFVWFYVVSNSWEQYLCLLLLNASLWTSTSH